MKYTKILAILLLSSVISFYSCNDDKADARKQKAKESLGVPSTATIPNVATPNPTTSESPQTAEGVWHYTCSKGCAGGAGAAGSCATCGGPLAHNASYHTNANSTPATNPIIPTPPTPAAEPAQNAVGVWHYTCGNGCAGGAGAAGPCGTCGGTLAHNAAYH